jgi:hypothetical protein
METLDPVLRSMLCRALGRAAEALDRVPESAMTQGWIRAHGRPAMVALAEVAQLLDEVPAMRPVPTVLIVGPHQTSPLPPTSVIKLACPHPGACRATPTWNPFGGHHGRYEPRRPSFAVTRQMAEALIAALGRPISPTELVIGLREAAACSARTAHRAIRAAVLARALAVDAENRITVPVRRAPAGEAEDWTDGDTLVAVRPEEDA